MWLSKILERAHSCAPPHSAAKTYVKSIFWDGRLPLKSDEVRVYQKPKVLIRWPSSRAPQGPDEAWQFAPDMPAPWVLIMVSRDEPVPMPFMVLRDESTPRVAAPGYRWDWQHNVMGYEDHDRGWYWEYRGVTGSVADVDPVMPPFVPLPMIKWLEKAIKDKKATGELTANLKTSEVAQALWPLLNRAAREGRVDHSTKNARSLEVTISREKLWP
jgi:hypothetical protein